MTDQCQLISALNTHNWRSCPECEEHRQTIRDLAFALLFWAANVTPIEPEQPDLPADSPTLEAFVASHFEPQVLAHLNYGGRKCYAYTLRRYLFPELGSSRLSEISYDMVQGLINRMLEAGFAVQTAQNTRKVLGYVFKHALRTGHFSGVPPTASIRTPRVRHRERRALSPKEALAVVESLKSPYSEMALLSMTTSLNMAEFCALRWQWVNLTRKSVVIQGTVLPPLSLFVRENCYEGVFGPPKTDNRRRCVPLPEAVVIALKKLRKLSRHSGPEDLVLSSRAGTPKRSSNLRRVLRPVAHRLGMPWLTWHAFRNTFATLGEQLGMSLADRQASLGHGTKWMTMHYTRSDIERQRRGGEKIAQKIAAKILGQKQKTALR
jgi:integrase